MQSDVSYLKFNEAVIKSLPNPIVVVDEQLKILIVNRGFKNIFSKLSNSITSGAYLTDFLQKNSELVERITYSINHESSQNRFMFIIDDQYYLITVNSIEEEIQKNYVVMFNNVTKQEEEERTRRKFISMVSHELRTPLAAISSHAELIAYHDDMNIKETRETAKVIYGEVQRLSNMVSELLDISKYDQMQIKLNKTEFNFNDIIEEVKLLYQTKDARDDVEIIFNDFDLNVYADYDKIKQVIINLLENAYVYTKSFVELKVEVKNNKFRLSVIDDGIGLSISEKEKIFNRFYRTDKSRNSNNGGSGLGLSIVKEIVELHNGKIFVHSEKGEGSEFIIEVPLRS